MSPREKEYEFINLHQFKGHTKYETQKRTRWLKVETLFIDSGEDMRGLNNFEGMIKDLRKTECIQGTDSFYVIVSGSWKTENELCVTLLVIVT